MAAAIKVVVAKARAIAREKDGLKASLMRQEDKEGRCLLLGLWKGIESEEMER